MSNNDWTTKLHNQLADFQEPVSKDLWAGIEQSLAQMETENMPQHSSRKISLYRWSAVAAAVVLLAVGGSYVYLQQSGTPTSSHLSASSRSLACGHSAASDHFSASSRGILAESSNIDLPEIQSPLPVTSASSPSSATTLTTTKYDDVSKSINACGVMKTSEVADSVAGANGASEMQLALARTSSTSQVASSYVVSRHGEGNSGWAVKLYAENLKPEGIGGFSGSGDAAGGPSSGVLSAPVPGIVANPSEGADNGVNYLLASYRSVQKTSLGDAKHHAPVSAGVQVAFGIAPRLSLSTGVVYTYTSSDFKPYYSNSYSIHQVLHYVGVPLGVNYEFWRSNDFHAYVMVGAEADWNVKNHTEENGEEKEFVKRDRTQFSGKVSLGAQYDITSKLGLYVEPGMKYYFDNGSEIENTFKDKKLNFNFQFGLRFNL